MYVVTVVFAVKPAHLEAFMKAVVQQAETSLAEEPGCHQFDVARDPDDALRVFLYEIYSDRAAFDLHLSSPHFKAFDQMTAAWLAQKSVKTFVRTWPSD